MNGHNNLIPIEKVNGIVQNHDQSLCNARDLHTFLGVGVRFNDWISRRIQQHGFVERQDFYSTLSKNRRGRPSVEYHLTIEAAKHIAMAEHTDKGKEARDYFIECERIALEDLRRTPELPSLDDLPICLYLPDDTEILCISDDGSIKTGFKMDSWSNRRGSRLVIGFDLRRFYAMSDSEIDLPHPEIFGFTLWIEMRGRDALVWMPQKFLPDPENRLISMLHAKTFIIGLPGAIDDLIYERGYSVTKYLTRNYGPRS